VAARAINNIIGGAPPRWVPTANRSQPGLLSDPANCARTRIARPHRAAAFPACARPIIRPGRPALVADVYQKWVVGASPKAAHDAAVLFENAQNPGDPESAILKRLSIRRVSVTQAPYE
jgi:hypothetical protein